VFNITEIDIEITSFPNLDNQNNLAAALREFAACLLDGANGAV